MQPPPSDPILQWLMQGNWQALARHFHSRPPVRALDFKARGLLRLQERRSDADWPAIVADLQEACRLEPGEASHWINLSQALLDCGQAEAAYAAARQGFAVAPGAVMTIQKLVACAARTQRYAEAADLLRAEHEKMADSAAPVPAALHHAIQDMELRWWEPLRADSVLIRRLRPDDAPFLRELFADREFMRGYNLNQGTTEDDIRRYLELAQMPPRHGGRLDWLLCDPDDRPVGIAALIQLDLENRTAVAMFGFRPVGQGLKKLRTAAAIIDFAFSRLRLHKLSSHVYANHAAAQKFTLELGFRQEGLLREQVSAGPGMGRLDLYVNGLLRQEFTGSRLYERLLAPH